MHATDLASPDVVTRCILNAVFQERRSPLIVDSPPGAGKTYLVESIAALAVEHFRWRVAIVTPKKNQSYDFLERFVERFPRSNVQLLHSTRDLVPDALAPPRVGRIDNVNNLVQGPGLVVATVDKLQFATPRIAQNEFDLLIIDEAYQCTYGKVFPLFSIARQILLVGDPGQLSPFTEIDEERFEAARDHVHWAVPRELVRKFPTIVRFQLPVTRRLPCDTVSFVQPSFYPNLPFVSAVPEGERSVEFAAVGFGDRIDRALDAIAAGATIVGISLPALNFQTDVDAQLSNEAAAIVERLISRRARLQSVDKVIESSMIGYCDTHVVSGTDARSRFDTNFADLVVRRHSGSHPGTRD